MKKIKLKHGKYALVDNRDYFLLSKFKWREIQVTKNNNIYAVRTDSKLKRVIYMHRQILGEIPKGKMTDHIDGDGLNNQRSNLRFATHSENMRNRKMALNNKSGFLGVSWNTTAKQWYATAKLNGKTHHIGHSKDILKAAKMYQEYALKNYKEFKRIIL